MPRSLLTNLHFARTHRIQTRAIPGLRWPAWLTLGILLVVVAAPTARALDSYSSAPTAPCDHLAEPGTSDSAAYLRSHYPAYSASLGLDRSCGTYPYLSDHGRGLAIDWGVSSQSATSKNDGQQFLNWLFAPDSSGQPHAHLRQLGIYMIIWQDHIWTASTGSNYIDPNPMTWPDYNEGDCFVKYGASTDCRHMRHMHISLGNKGGSKSTSWWTSPSVRDSGPRSYVPGTVVGSTVTGRVSVATMGVQWGKPTTLVVSGLASDSESPSAPVPVKLRYDTNGVTHEVSDSADVYRSASGQWEYKFEVDLNASGDMQTPSVVEVLAYDDGAHSWVSLGSRAVDAIWAPTGGVSVATMGGKWGSPTHLVVSGLALDGDAPGSHVPVQMTTTGADGTNVYEGVADRSSSGQWEYKFDIDLADANGTLAAVSSVSVRAFDPVYETWTWLGTKTIEVGALPTGSISVATMGSKWGIPTHLVVSGYALDADTPSVAPLVHLWYKKADGTSASSSNASMTWRSEVGKWEYKFNLDLGVGSGYAPIVDKVGVYVFDTWLGNNGTGLKTNLGSKPVPHGTAPSGSIVVATMGAQWNVPTHLIVTGLALDPDTTGLPPEIWLSITHEDGTVTTSSASTATWRSAVGKWEYKFNLDLADSQGNYSKVTTVRTYALDTSFGASMKTALGLKNVS